MIRPQLCPICKKTVQPTDDSGSSWFPFCSDRCRKVDFIRWWDGRYGIVEDLNPAEAKPMQPDSDLSGEIGDPEH